VGFATSHQPKNIVNEDYAISPNQDDQAPEQNISLVSKLALLPFLTPSQLTIIT